MFGSVNTSRRSATLPYVKGITGASQTLNNATWTEIAFNTNVDDEWAMHSTSTNTGRFIAQIDGWYRLNAVISFAQPGTAAGYRSLRLTKNGNLVRSLINAVAVSGNPTVIPIAYDLPLAAGEFATIQGYHTQGAALAVTGNDSFNDVGTYLTLQYTKALY